MLSIEEMLLDAPACQAGQPDALACQLPLAGASRDGTLAEAARRSREAMPRILYLDFDGVLHPHDVFLESGKPVLRPDPAYGIPDWVELFSFCPILEAALEPHPDVRIVLSTSWAAHLGLDFAKDALPAGLRDRVIGATCAGRHHELEKWLLAPSRYAQIARHAQLHGIRDWIAIDDDTEGWPDDQRYRLVGIENPTMGLYLESVQARLREVLNGTG